MELLLVEQGAEPGEAEVQPGRAREGAGGVSKVLVTCPGAGSGRGEGGRGFSPTPGCVGAGVWVLALTLGSGPTQPRRLGRFVLTLTGLDEVSPSPNPCRGEGCSRGCWSWAQPEVVAKPSEGAEEKSLPRSRIARGCLATGASPFSPRITQASPAEGWGWEGAVGSAG